MKSRFILLCLPILLTADPAQAQRESQYSCGQVISLHAALGTRGLQAFGRRHGVTGRERAAAMRCLGTGMGKGRRRR